MSGVDVVLELFARWGDERYDEDVSQTDHARQCAALARRAGASDALVVAALLHDVGHLLHLADGGAPVDGIDPHHEVRGAEWLSAWFGPAVTGPVRLHVAAKRYLCAVDPAHAAGLSAGSRRSLIAQGGAMAPDEAARFGGLPGAADAVALRRWDDAGKVTGLDRPTVADHRDLLLAVTRA